MPAVSTIIAGVSAAAALAGTVHAVESSAQARRDAEAGAKKAEEQQARAMAEADAQSTKADAASLRDQQMARQRAKAGNAGGRSSTILTSPLGVSGSASTTMPTAVGTKTLLGS